ncbi:transposase [Ktedonobacter sp. SOSP1-52]|uniref:IS982 family transposase n=1 Tax=Ktedonobacter sp. SOSP1-52 TaxID=2778366 RepID=UPI0019151EFC|nr:IS982 family transposase [Ktedonobacter sp. SOSP1-52]GHO64322.1 transposase [Ktedonobacter sp. SOSP1-52]
MLDKATVLTTLFLIVDDLMKGSAVIKDALERPGPAPQLSDSEVVTIALYQELIGEPREDHFFRLHHEQLRPFFPGLNERSRYNRRKRSLWAVILAIRAGLCLVQEAQQMEETAAIDSAPVPCISYKRSKKASDFAGHADYGVCSSKAMKYFGCKLHSLVGLSGVILGFLLTPASHYDNQPVVELLDSVAHHLKRLIGDGAYNDQALQRTLEHTRSLLLFAPVKANQPAKRSATAQKVLNRLRLICETVNAQLQEQFHLSKHYAKSVWGLFTRIAVKVTAHSAGMMLNTLLGRPPLKLADLAV